MVSSSKPGKRRWHLPTAPDRTACDGHGSVQHYTLCAVIDARGAGAVALVADSAFVRAVEVNVNLGIERGLGQRTPELAGETLEIRRPAGATLFDQSIEKITVDAVVFSLLALLGPFPRGYRVAVYETPYMFDSSGSRTAPTSTSWLKRGVGMSTQRARSLASSRRYPPSLRAKLHPHTTKSTSRV